MRPSFLVLCFALIPAAVLGCKKPQQRVTPDSEANIAAKARVAPVSPSASASSGPPVASSSAAPSVPPEPPPVCSSACGAGTSCNLTRNGAACTACAPGSLPVCKDQRTLVSCADNGSIKSVDCNAQGKRCSQGMCVARECTPNALHCFERNVHRCDASGDSRTLVKNCENEGPCQQIKGGAPACQFTCDAPDHQIVALWDCGPCDWSTTPFCAEESNQPERGCNDNICLHEEGKKVVGFGVVSIPCFRNTEGLVVPGSDQPGPCEGQGPIGSRKISYQVCKGGKPSTVLRVAPCQK